MKNNSPPTENTENNDTAKKLEPLPRLLVPWYEQNKRDLPWRRTRDPYRIFVSEIMLQQTRVNAAIGYYERFFSLFPTVHVLARADDDLLLKAWEGLGYYSRARNLKRAARIVADEYDGVFPASPSVLRLLPGVGDYTAGAVASIAFGLPVAAVDGNVLRIVARVLDYNAPVTPPFKRTITDALTRIYPVERCGSFTQSFMDLGSAICLPSRPACLLCPLRAVCAAYAHGTAESLPVRAPKAAKKQQKLTVFVLRNDDTVGVQKRSDTGLLASLWELPNRSGHLSDGDAVRVAETMGVRICGEFSMRRARHVFTHIEWDMLVFDAQTERVDDSLVWVNPNANEQAALPTAFRKCL